MTIRPHRLVERQQGGGHAQAEQRIFADEELGGALMHSTVSGLGEYLAEDDREALGIARQVVAQMDWPARMHAMNSAGDTVHPPHYPADDLLALMPDSLREPVDMREIMARLADGSELLEFKPLYGTATLCVEAFIDGHAVGLISNNGPIDVAGANKATHFIARMCQLGHPLIYLQNTTG